MEGTCHKVPNRSFLSPTADYLIRFLIGTSYHQQLITYDYIYGSAYVAEHFRSSNCFSTSFTFRVRFRVSIRVRFRVRVRSRV